MEFSAVALTLALAVSPASAQAPQSPDSPFIEAVRLVQRASAGDSSAIAPAVAAFQKLTQADPQQPLYEAYLGSATGLKAADAWMPWTKLKYAEEALDHADRALKSLTPAHDRELMRGAPVGIETRLIAARLYLRTPDEFFHRRAAGRKLVADVLARPDFAAVPPPLRAVAYVAAAEAARGERPDEEIARLKEAVAIAPASHSAEVARSRLKELGQ